MLFVILILRNKLNEKLKDIAEIRTGFFGRPVTHGDIVYLQNKQFDDNGQLATRLYPDLIAAEVSQKHLLRPGDILFAAKGSKNFAAVFDRPDIKAVASTSFFVLSVNPKIVLPAYICWYLNVGSTQNLLKTQAMGSSIPSISKQVLEALSIPVPTYTKQQQIVQLAALQHRQRDIMTRLAILQHQQTELSILNAIQ